MPQAATATAAAATLSSSPLSNRRMDWTRNQQPHTTLKSCDLRKRRSLDATASYHYYRQQKQQLESQSNQQQHAHEHRQEQQQHEAAQTKTNQNDDELLFRPSIINRGNRSRSLIESRSNVPLGLKPPIDSYENTPTSSPEKFSRKSNASMSPQEVRAPPRSLPSPLRLSYRPPRQSPVHGANGHERRSLSAEFELNLSMLQEELGYPRINRTASVTRMRGRSLMIPPSSSSTGQSSFSSSHRGRNNSSFLENLSDSFVSILTDRESHDESVTRASLQDDSLMCNTPVPAPVMSLLPSPPLEPVPAPISSTSTHSSYISSNISSSSSSRSLHHRHSVSGPLSSGSFRGSLEPEMELGPDGSNYYVDGMHSQLAEILIQMDGDDLDMDGRDEEEDEDEDHDDFLKYRIASVTGYSRGADGVVYYEIIVESILFGPLSAYKVRRRYSEFRDLHRALGTIMSSSGHNSALTKMLETQPTAFQSDNERLCQSATVRLHKSTLPPLPDQGGLWNFFRGDSPTFLEKRAKYFHAIITAAQNDLVARKSRILHKFLGTPPDSIAMNSSLENSYVSLNRFAAPKLRLSVEVQERKQKAKNISMKRSMAGRPPHSSSTHSMISSTSHRPRGIREMYLMEDDPFIAQVEDEINGTGRRRSTMTSPMAAGIYRSSVSSGMALTLNDLSL